MRTLGNLAFGFVFTLLILAVIAVVFALVAVASFGLEMLAQHWHLYGNPDDYPYYEENDEGAVFVISFVVLMIAVIGAAVYAYDERGEE